MDNSRDRFSKAKITRHERLSDKTLLIRFSVTERAFHAFSPGMFLMLRLSADSYDPLLNRPFSISNANKTEHWFEILYRVVGKGTAILSRKKPGEYLSILGPLGHGFPHPQAERAVLIGGGMGIAPLLSLLTSNMIKIQAVFWGIKEEVEYFDPGMVCPPLHDIPTHLASEDGSFGTKGLVTELVESFLKSSLKGPPAIFACGPVRMLKVLHAFCDSRDFSLFVSMEARMACGLGYCQGCAIPGADGKGYLKVCQDGPVFKSTLIDWERIFE